MDSDRHLYRSTHDRAIAGVASGLALYFGVDPTLVRVLFAVLIIAGIGIPLYLICWLLIPREPADIVFIDNGPRPRSIGRTLLQIVALLIIVAILNEHVGRNSAIIAFVVGGAIGAYFLLRNRGARADESTDGTSLYRSVVNRRVLGVFGGLAEILHVDATLLRALGVVLVIAGFPVTLALYLLYALVVPVRRVIVL